MCSRKLYYGFFYGGFGAVASSLLSGLSGYVDIGLVCRYKEWTKMQRGMFPSSFLEEKLKENQLSVKRNVKLKVVLACNYT